MKVISWRAPWWKVCQLKRAQGPVLKIRYHGYHGRGTKGIWGDQRDVYCFFLRIFGRLFWSSHNLCSVPSNSVYGPPKIIVLSPQIPFIVPQKSLFCPLLITNHCSPTKIIVMSPQIPLIPYQIPFIVPQKYCFVPS